MSSRTNASPELVAARLATTANNNNTTTHNEEETQQQHSNKRVRINEDQNEVITNKNTAPPQENTAPSAASKAALREAVRSHPNAIQDIAEALLKEYIILKTEERQQANTLARFDDDAWIPKSAKITFKLSSRESIMEKEEFKKLTTEATEKTKAYQQEAKSLIKSVLLLAIQESKSQFSTLMERALFQIGTLILLKDKAYKNEPPTEKFVWHCLTKDEIPARVFDYTSTKRHVLLNIFKQKSTERLRQEESTSVTVTQMDHSLTQFEMEDNSTQEAVEASQQQAVISTEETAYFNTLCVPFSELITAIFANCWDRQVNAHAQLDAARRLTKQAKTFLKEKTSKAVAIELEKEPKTEPKRISQLIHQEIDKANKKINKKVDRVVQQLNRSTKNNLRGANQKKDAEQSPTSASSTKKKGGNINNNTNKKSNNKQGSGQKEKTKEKTKEKSGMQPKRKAARGRSPVSRGNASPSGKPKHMPHGGPTKRRGNSKSTPTKQRRS
jgi:hypothetical protein